MADKSDNTYFGYVEKDLRLTGQTSNAQATISNVRLRSDTVGSVIGSFFIPDPNKTTSPKFDTGKKVFRLTSNSVNSQNAENVTTDATRIFESSGSIETVQSTIISVKNIHTEILTRQESKSIRGNTVSTSSGGNNNNNNQPSLPVVTTVTRDIYGVGTAEVEITTDSFGTTSEVVKSAWDPVDQAFQDVFGREPDKGGKAYWYGQVEADLAAAGITKASGGGYEAAFYLKTTEYLGGSREALEHDNEFTYATE